MTINKPICLVLLFSLMLNSCGNEPSEAKELLADNAKVEATSDKVLNDAESKVDAIIDSSTASELEAAKVKEEEARLAKEKADKARREKVEAENRAKAEAVKEKKAKERRRKRRKKREEARKAKAAAEKAREEKARLDKEARAQSVSETAVVEYDQQTSHSTSTNQSGKPVVQFYNMTHNYGKIEQGDKVEYKFKFKNIGTSELVVNDATATCGCTMPSYPFIPIGPGEEGYIGVVFDSKGKLGRQKPAVTINTNADPASYKLYLEGFVNSPEEDDKEVVDEGEK